MQGKFFCGDGKGFCSRRKLQRWIGGWPKGPLRLESRWKENHVGHIPRNLRCQQLLQSENLESLKNRTILARKLRCMLNYAGEKKKKKKGCRPPFGIYSFSSFTTG